MINIILIYLVFDSKVERSNKVTYISLKFSITKFSQKI